MSTQTITPFQDDADYLDAAIAALHAKCRRIVAERTLKEAQQGTTRDDPEEAQQRASMTAQREKDITEALAARLAVHRAEGTFTLGIDKLTHEADLNEAERTVLVCCFTSAISEDTAAQVFNGLDFAVYVSMTAEGIARVVEASMVGERLRVRRMLDEQAPLRKHGLVVLDGKSRSDVPEDLNGVNVKLTAKAFSVLTGGEVKA